MRRLDDLKLSEADRKAVMEAERRLKARFPVTQLIVFGSVARGEADEESDLDLLALTTEPFSHQTHDAVADVIFEINLEYGTNLTVLCIEEASWNGGLHSMISLREEVRRDGVVV